MQSRDKQDVDTSVGRGDPGSDVGPTSGRAAAPSTEDALALGGTGAGSTGYPGDGAEDSRQEQEDPAGGYGTGLETGNAARGSSANAAQRVDTFNTPGQ